jgi:ribosome biogenesis GTPase
MKLQHLGFSDFFAAQLDDDAAFDDLFRVTRASGELCGLAGLEPVQTGLIPARVRDGPAGPPVVGDWVLADRHATDVVVRAVLERRTQIARRAVHGGRKRRGGGARKQVIAANVDVVFIVAGLDGDFSPRRIERYLVLAHDAGTRPVVLLTKAGLVSDADAKVSAAQAVSPGVAVHAIDVVSGIHGDVPRTYATRGSTVAMLGSSGAGKSTLVNHLFGAERMPTGAVRGTDDKGRHTTTHRELTWTPDGAALIDNPGMRELALWVEGDGLDETFVDVNDRAVACRFSNCTHTHEPGCALIGAVERGELDGARLDSYRDLKAEVAATELRRDAGRRRAEERKFGKLYRAVQKANRKRRG